MLHLFLQPYNDVQWGCLIWIGDGITTSFIGMMIAHKQDTCEATRCGNDRRRTRWAVNDWWRCLDVLDEEMPNDWSVFLGLLLEHPQYIDDHATCALIDCITTSHLLHTHVRKSSWHSPHQRPKLQALHRMRSMQALALEMQSWASVKSRWGGLASMWRAAQLGWMFDDVWMFGPVSYGLI